MLTFKLKDNLIIVEGTSENNHEEDMNNIWINEEGNLVILNKTYNNEYFASHNIATTLNLEELKQIVLIMEQNLNN